MNYQFIHSPEDIHRYFTCLKKYVCQDLDISDCAIKFMLQSRRKYNPMKQSTGTILLQKKIFKMKNTTDDFIRSIKKLQIEKGLYQDKKIQTDFLDGQSMVIYCSSNVLSYNNAGVMMTKEIISNFLGNSQKIPPADDLYRSCLHKCPISKIQTLDVDTKDPSILQRLDQCLKSHNADLILIIETMNGYHYTFRSGPVIPYVDKIISEVGKEIISRNNNGMHVMPGTWQSAWPVKLKFCKE